MTEVVKSLEAWVNAEVQLRQRLRAIVAPQVEKQKSCLHLHVVWKPVEELYRCLDCNAGWNMSQIKSMVDEKLGIIPSRAIDT